jgi:hypothetical protein
VTHIREDRYKIDYLGLLSGEYDLAPLLQQSDGRPASSLAPLAVRVSTQLPPGHGTDVFGLESPRVSIVSRYEALAGIAISLWIAAPIVAISLRALRRKPTVIVPPPPTQPSATELLRDAVRRAQGRDLTTDERARLELLLFRALTESRAGASTAPADVSRAIAALRSDPHTEGVVLAVERWLHAEQPEGAEAALRALDAHTRNPAGAGA